MESTVSGRPFPDHTVQSAPPGARDLVRATVRHLGYLDPGVARLATSPQLLDAFLKSNALFESTTFTPVEREVVVFVMATGNGCHICVAMHTGRLVALGAGDDLIAALREQRELPDPRLEALRAFTLHVRETAGAVQAGRLAGFLAHGYTPRNALETVLGIGTYTMSTLANRMTGAPLSERLACHAWSPAG